MISTTIIDRGIALGTSGDVTGRRVRATAPVMGRVSGAALPVAVDTSARSCITAELRASSFAGGHVWFRPATLDVLVPTTPGHLAWSPPT